MTVLKDRRLCRLAGQPNKARTGFPSVIRSGRFSWSRTSLQETLVVMVGEFGRTPQINPTQGREHWGMCYTGLLAGGGVRGGQVE